jgi:hypothetical protein
MTEYSSLQNPNFKKPNIECGKGDRRQSQTFRIADFGIKNIKQRL